VSDLLNPVLREAEFRRCARDAIYFLSEYWKVQKIGVGYGKFTLFPYQVEDAEDFVAVHSYADRLLAWRNGDGEPPAPEEVRKLRQIRLKARQLGWTTLATGLVFWSVFFHENHPWLIAAQGQEDASITMKTQIKAPYSHLPKWMRERGPQVIQDGAEDFGFDNGSRIRVIPSTPSAGRGDAMFGALMDEAAFAESASELFAAIDPMCYGPMFVFSTANGMGNFFHDTWNDSQMSDSEWEGKFRPWHSRPGRDQLWYEATERKYRSKMHLFYQEYPSSPEEAFAKSGRLALPVEDMERLQPIGPPHWRYDVSKIVMAVYSAMAVGGVDDWNGLFADAVIGDSELPRDAELHVWRQPEVVRDEHGRLAYMPNYVVGADVAEGLEKGDYQALAVVDANTFEVVATMKSHTPLQTYDLLLEAVGFWYHTALVGPERNNHGMVPLIALQNRMYPRIYRMDTLAQIRTADRSPRYGWHTGPATKPKMVTDLADYLSDMGLVVHDERLLIEARTFLSNGKGGYGATDPNHDDLIMAHAVALQLALDVASQTPPIFYDTEPGPPTFGEVLAFPTDDRPHGVALSAPIGQRGKVERRRSWTFTPA